MDLRASAISGLLPGFLKAGDSFKLSKKAIQNGKKVAAKLDFESLKKQEPVHAVQPLKQDDGFKQLMQRCVLEAVEIVKTVNTIALPNEDVRSIALTMFIQRARVH